MNFALKLMSFAVVDRPVVEIFVNKRRMGGVRERGWLFQQQPHRGYCVELSAGEWGGNERLCFRDGLWLGQDQTEAECSLPQRITARLD